MSFTVMRPLRLIVLVDDEQLFDAVLLQDALGFFERGADGDGDEIVLRHDVADRLIEVALEAQIAVGEDADEALAARHRQAGDPVLVHDVERLADGELGRNRHRIDDHAAFRALHAVDFFGLAIDGHVAVDEADAALAGDGDGQARVGDGVHGGGHDRDIDCDLARKAGARVGLRGQHRGFAGQQQYVVKRQPFGNISVNHCVSYGYFFVP